MTHVVHRRCGRPRVARETSDGGYCTLNGLSFNKNDARGVDLRNDTLESGVNLASIRERQFQKRIPKIIRVSRQRDVTGSPGVFNLNIVAHEFVFAIARAFCIALVNTDR